MTDSNFVAGNSTHIDPGCIVGLSYKDNAPTTRLGDNCFIRAGSIIYAGVVIGDHVQTGHHVMIRENTKIGNHVVIGTNSVCDGNTTIDAFVKIESNCYIPTHCSIGTRVFLGPGVVLTNDRYPLKLRDTYKPEGVILEDGVTLGAGVVVCPGVTIGADSFVAAGAVVTRDIPPRSFVKGVPGQISTLPPELVERNMALSWRGFLDPDS